MRCPVLLSSLLLPATLAAQDRSNTILVLDGSGSMWGQIDGPPKITIAQDVVTDLPQKLPAEQRLRPTVYGHHERGSCADIKTVIGPASATICDTVQVAWSGSNAARDFIAISEVGESGYVNYRHSNSSNPVQLAMPEAASTYKIRYHFNQDRTVIGSRLITETE